MASSEKAFTVWFTGLSGAGKSTISHLVAAELERRGQPVELLDGDAVRRHLSSELGFSKEHRDLNVERIGWVASRLVRAGAVVVVAAISPYREARRRARALVEEHGAFVEVHVATSLAERQLIMVTGQIAAETTAEALIADPAAQRRYLGVEPLADAA